MEFQSIHHVNVVVDDVDKARDFYSKVLGLYEIDDRVGSERPGGHYAVGNSQIHLTIGNILPQQGQHFALEVNDLEGTIHELERAQIKIRRNENPNRAQIAISDPAGNQIEIRATES